jgi:hypothetical protein
MLFLHKSKKDSKIGLFKEFSEKKCPELCSWTSF